MRSGRPLKDRASSPRSPTTLRYLRLLMGITQKQLAIASGVSQTAISDYENGLAMPADQGRNLYMGLKLFAHLEHYYILNSITHADLPRPWEIVLETIREESYATY
jgi:transcriptional regulator with XRE-family HTH domain